jgi:hypothetical protein
LKQRGFDLDYLEEIDKKNVPKFRLLNLKPAKVNQEVE